MDTYAIIFQDEEYGETTELYVTDEMITARGVAILNQAISSEDEDERYVEIQNLFAEWREAA